MNFQNWEAPSGLVIFWRFFLRGSQPKITIGATFQNLRPCLASIFWTFPWRLQPKGSQGQNQIANEGNFQNWEAPSGLVIFWRLFLGSSQPKITIEATFQNLRPCLASIFWTFPWRLQPKGSQGQNQIANEGNFLFRTVFDHPNRI
jgi:hypothetical protein